MNDFVNDVDIDNVRSVFMDEVDSNPDLYDEVDVERVKADNWTIERYLIHTKGDQQEAIRTLIATMKWRKELDVNNIKETDFPQEFYLTSECHTYVPDQNGIGTVYIRVKLHKANSEFNELFQKFVVMQFEKLEKESKRSGKGWALIYDCSGGTLFNVDIGLLNFMVNAWHSHYPSNLVYVALYDLPWILRAIYYMARSWIPERYHKLILMVNKDTLAEHVGRQNLPDYLHGTCEVDYVCRVEKALSLNAIAEKNGISESGLRRFVNHYSKYYKRGAAKIDLILE